MADGWSTHTVELLPDRVVKRYRQWAEREHEREWQALTLLQAYAPGLSPAPLDLDPGPPTPTLVMSRLPGAVLRGGIVGPAQISALAAALTELHHCVPADVAEGLPRRTWSQRQCVEYIRRRYPELAGRALDPEITRAAADGMTWLDATASRWNHDPGLPPVLGQADGNLANFLWDGTRIGIVDFEESGRSDIPFELAELVEHVGSWVDTDFGTDAFLAHFPLETAGLARLAECRRLLALLWLLSLSLVGPDDDRNPPDTPLRQARRLRALLDARPPGASWVSSATYRSSTGQHDLGWRPLRFPRADDQQRRPATVVGKVWAPAERLVIGARLVDAGEDQPGREDAADQRGQPSMVLGDHGSEPVLGAGRLPRVVVDRPDGALAGRYPAGHRVPGGADGVLD
jgi:Phosphotransferase enzyme family